MAAKKVKVVVLGGLAILGVLGLMEGGWFLFFAIKRAREAARLTPLKFDLSNRVQIKNDPALEFRDGAFTISFWFRTTSKQRYLTMMSKRIDPMGDGWIIHGQENNTFLFYTAGCASPVSTPQNFRDGQWHHLAFVRTGKVMNIFYDSRQIGSGPEPCNHNDRHPIRIGMDGDKGWHFDGDLTEVHFYNRGLNPTEVAEEWNNGKGLKKAVKGGGLVAGYHFDEKPGVAPQDFSNHGHNGTVIRSAVPIGERN